MTKLVTTIKSGSDSFEIYEGLQIGETIYAGEKSITVKNDKELESLKAGKLPESKYKKSKLETSEVTGQVQNHG